MHGKIKNQKGRNKTIVLPEILQSKPVKPSEDCENYKELYEKYLEDLEKYEYAWEKWKEQEDEDEDDVLESDFRRRENIIKKKNR